MPNFKMKLSPEAQALQKKWVGHDVMVLKDDKFGNTKGMIVRVSATATSPGQEDRIFFEKGIIYQPIYISNIEYAD